MKNSPYGKALWLIGSLNTMLLSIPLPYLFLNLFPEAEGVLLLAQSIGIALPVLLLKIVGEKVKGKAGRGLLAFGIAALFIVFSLGPVMRTAYTLVLAFYLLLVLAAPRPEGRILLSKPQPWQGVVFLLLFALGSGNGNQSIRSASAVLFVLFLLLYLLDRNMEKVEKKLLSSDAVSSPSAVLRVNNRLMVLFSILFLLFSIAVPFLLSGTEERKESTVTYVFGEEETEDTEEKWEVLASRDIALSPKGKALSGRFFSLFPIVLTFLVSLGAIFFLLYAVLSLIFSFRHGEALQAEERIEETILVKRTKEEAKEKEERPGYFSLEGRVRRLYRRTILLGLEGKVDDALTPAELEEKAHVQDSALHEVYEKARYSQQGVDEKDLERVKKRKSSK
ncbi:MAG: hypothetical protein KBS81_07860 [Spirochaetales bacterium]|nr:hypothetical protein [Candidatus Physcosoma equi]